MQRLDNTNILFTGRKCFTQFRKCNFRLAKVKLDVLNLKSITMKINSQINVLHTEGKAHQKVLQMAKNILPFFRALFAASIARSKLFTIN